MNFRVGRNSEIEIPLGYRIQSFCTLSIRQLEKIGCLLLCFFFLCQEMYKGLVTALKNKLKNKETTQSMRTLGVTPKGGLKVSEA